MNNLPLAAKKTPLKWHSPMLATLTSNYFSDSGWIYECKMDGERCLVYCDSKGVITLYSRTKQILNRTYPELVEALANTSHNSFIIDGEIVACDKEGLSSFSKLQSRIGLQNPTAADVTHTPVYYYVFDITYLNGFDLRNLPLIRRKALLRQHIIFNERIIYTKDYKKYGLKFYEIACQKKWEGIIAKRAESSYQERRSRDWLKFKCSNEQEFIIIGYTDPQGTRIGFGALLLGYYEHGKLKYAGKVGTGFDRKMLQFLINKLQPLEQKLSPIMAEKIAEKHVHWLKPELVCEIGFSEWTHDNKLRHPRFLGLRYDKATQEVIKENPSS